MNEEQAVFGLGKRLSAGRNSGKPMPAERIRVGVSWVLPEELTDEYDKHHPPVPRKHRPVTKKRFDYSPMDTRECRGELVGLHIKCRDREIDGLKDAAIIECNFNERTPGKIASTRCNRYDILYGRDFTIVIDKLEEQVSVLRGPSLALLALA